MIKERCGSPRALLPHSTPSRSGRGEFLQREGNPSPLSREGQGRGVYQVVCKRESMAGSKIMGVFLFLLGSFVCYQGIDLSLGMANRPGPGFVPFGLGLVLMTLAAIYLRQSRTNKARRPESGVRYRRTALALGILCFYALVVNWAGYILTTFFSFILWLSLIERKAWFQTASLAFLAAVAVYVFNALFSVQLPAGFLKGILR